MKEKARWSVCIRGADSCCVRTTRSKGYNMVAACKAGRRKIQQKGGSLVNNKGKVCKGKEY